MQNNNEFNIATNSIITNEQITKAVIDSLTNNKISITKDRLVKRVGKILKLNEEEQKINLLLGFLNRVMESIGWIYYDSSKEFKKENN